MVGLHWGWGEAEGGCQTERKMGKEKEKKKGKGKEEVEEDGLKKKEDDFLNFPYAWLSISTHQPHDAISYWCFQTPLRGHLLQEAFRLGLSLS